MRILALETSTLLGSVAALVDEHVVAEVSFEPPQRTARSLSPAIEQCLHLANWTASNIELVAVSQGPGSFTGLRLGVTTAKVLAYACSAQLIGINTLRAIAAQTNGDMAVPVTAVLDAHRQQLFAATFIRNGAGQWQETIPTGIVDEHRWLERLTDSTAVTGTGLRKIMDHISADVPIVDESLWQPQARTVGRLALEATSPERSVDYWQLVPNYYRRSAAEEKLKAE